jgi:Secretion system C-terminal sorting domain
LYDLKPDDGENQYRIQLFHLDGTVLNSDIKTVQFTILSNVTIFPNPAQNEINIALKGYSGKTVDIILYNLQGQPVHIEHITDLQKDVHSFSVDEKRLSGLYMMHIKAQGKRDVLKSVIIE